MRKAEYIEINAEIASLKLILAGIPSSDVIDQLSVKNRISDLESRLSSDPLDTRVPKKAKLTFRGKPVVGSYGIYAEFGARVMGAFSETVAIVSASITGALTSLVGPVPNRIHNQLLITGPARGSFGFEIEEHVAPDVLVDVNGPVSDALDRVLSVMKASTSSDEDLADSLQGLHQRAIDSIRSFLENVDNGEALCALEIDNEVFRFQDYSQLKNSIQRLSHDNVVETQVTFNGKIIGVLPRRRTFEYQISNDPVEVISGKIGLEIEDATVLLKDYLEIDAVITVTQSTVGNGRPRYTLLEISKDKV